MTKQSSIEIDFTYLKVASNCVRGHEELVRATNNCESLSVHSIGLKACENEHSLGRLQRRSLADTLLSQLLLRHISHLEAMLVTTRDSPSSIDDLRKSPTIQRLSHFTRANLQSL